MQILTERAMSGFLLSVGTGLALESCYKATDPVIDPDRVIPKQIDTSKYNTFAINVRTLIRNIYQSLPAEFHKEVNSGAIYDTLVQEIDLLKNIINNDITKSLFYTEDYNSYHKQISKYVLLRQSTTNLQKLYDALEFTVVNRYMKTNGIPIFGTMHNERVLILTHIPRDLLYNNRVKSLDLLESHTGKLKQKDIWGSKYFRIKDYDLSHLPFTEELLFIFGDNIMYRPQSLELRRGILSISEKYNWHSNTTRDRIWQSIEVGKVLSKGSLDIVKNIFK
jgi:hypothetical protein